LVLQEKERLDKEEATTTTKLLCLQKQRRFLKKRASTLISCSLRTINKLDKVKDKERQIKEKHATAKAIAKLSIALQAAPKQFANPFAKIKISLLLLKV
jgi:hypothetical protein